MSDMHAIRIFYAGLLLPLCWPQLVLCECFKSCFPSKRFYLSCSTAYTSIVQGRSMMGDINGFLGFLNEFREFWTDFAVTEHLPPYLIADFRMVFSYFKTNKFRGKIRDITVKKPCVFLITQNYAEAPSIFFVGVQDDDSARTAETKWCTGIIEYCTRQGNSPHGSQSGGAKLTASAQLVPMLNPAWYACRQRSVAIPVQQYSQREKGKISSQKIKTGTVRWASEDLVAVVLSEVVVILIVDVEKAKATVKM